MHVLLFKLLLKVYLSLKVHITWLKEMHCVGENVNIFFPLKLLRGMLFLEEPYYINNRHGNWRKTQ